MTFFKWTALGVGGVVAVAHIGVLGHIITATKVPEAPVINFPRGDYSSYKIEAGKEGYSIEYRANDPAVLESQKSLSLDKDKKGLFGGSMAITSLGGIGGSFFTPIINYPEVAILGVGKSEKKQIYIGGKYISRMMLPLSLSYDHRIIDGAEAARFNNELKENLGKNFAYKLAV